MAKYRNRSGFSAALDYGVSALAAGSAGFVAFAMPQALLSAIVVKSGLPNLIAAAQPPLGDTARLAIVAGTALLTFAFVWSLMRALDREPVRADVAEEAESEAPVPRLRKADAHPDAPARRPILAGRELGEPIDSDAPEPQPEPEPVAEVETPEEPAPLPRFLVAEEAEPEPDAPAIPEPEVVAEPEAAAEPAPEPEPAADLSKLMERFETGLVRKQQAIVRPEPAPQAIPAAPVAESAPGEEPSDRVGHRLRNAIAGLQQASGGAG